MLRALIVAALLPALWACSSQPMRDLRSLFQPSKGYYPLKAGLQQFDDGSYADAARNLQAAIDMGLSDGDRAEAHKHLAFIHCASNRERACRDEFRKALSIEPSLVLDPAESGHPVWGPVFVSLKAEPASRNPEPVSMKPEPASTKPEPAESVLKTGLQQYDDGDYDESAKNLQTAIDQGLNPRELAIAHKHLAFIHCASNRERLCREEFRKALAADRSLDLAPAEAGHPIWGPVFRSVKAGR